MQMDLCTKLVRTMEKLKKRWCFKEISPSYLPDPSSVPACLIMKKRGFHAPLGNTNIQVLPASFGRLEVQPELSGFSHRVAPLIFLNRGPRPRGRSPLPACAPANSFTS